MITTGWWSVSKADEADAAEVLRLQEVLRGRHQELTGARGEVDRSRQLAKVFTATNELLDFEARMPLLRDERLRKVSSVVVYAATGIAGAAMLVGVVLMLLGRISW